MYKVIPFENNCLLSENLDQIQIYIQFIVEADQKLQCLYAVENNILLWNTDKRVMETDGERKTIIFLLNILNWHPECMSVKFS